MKNGRPASRFAVSVNRKVGGSVQRNYIKRKMKEWFRLNACLLPTALDVWVSMKKSFDRSSAPKVQMLFLEALIKARSR